MTDAATVEWLDVVPGDDDKRALESWAYARGVSLSLPADVAVWSRTGDPQVPRDVERNLEAARDAVAKLDGRSAEVALSHADGLLREHPELPQGAWLMAEVHRGWAARWSRVAPRSDERATEEWGRARALDGGRAAGVGEESFETKDKPVSYTLEAELPPGATLTWDGAPVEPGDHQALEGVHQLRAVRSGAVVFASWVSVAAGGHVRVSVPGPPACSQADVGSARFTTGTLVATGVRCGSWIAVVKKGPASLAVARCEGDRCGDLLPWSNPTPAPMTLPGAPAGWAAWKTWAIVSGLVVGAAVIAGIVVFATGVFTPTSTTRQPFVNAGPPKPE